MVKADNLTTREAVTRRPVRRSSWSVQVGSAVVATAVVAAHVGCQGWVMTRHWLDADSPDGVGRYSVDVVVISVAVVVLAGIAAVFATEVWPAPAAGWRSLLPARPGFAVLGVAVALFVLLGWGMDRDGSGILPVGFTAVMYALPWGFGLAAIGWLRGRAAVVAGVTVLLSAVVCAVFAVSIHILAYPTAPVGD